METVAEGLQTQMGYELTQEILQALLTDFILVSDEEMFTAYFFSELRKNLRNSLSEERRSQVSLSRLWR